MYTNTEKEKIIECIFDSDVSIILEQLENGEKEIKFLTEALQISKDEILKRISILIEKEFVKIKKNNDLIMLALDDKKLSNIIEQDSNFKKIEDGLTKMDSYLN